MASRVVLGLGGCVDYELRLSSSTLQQLIAEYEIRDSELALSVPVTDERDLDHLNARTHEARCRR